MDFGSDKITGRSIKPIDPGPFYTTPSPPSPSLYQVTFVETWVYSRGRVDISQFFFKCKHWLELTQFGTFNQMIRFVPFLIFFHALRLPTLPSVSTLLSPFK